jgi:hypothetical protein
MALMSSMWPPQFQLPATMQMSPNPSVQSWTVRRIDATVRLFPTGGGTRTTNR